jgi:hypothetical protein
MIKQNVPSCSKSIHRPIERTRVSRSLALACISAFALLLLTSCGGGGGGCSSSSSGNNNPAPSVISISPSSAPAGSRALTVTVKGTQFLSGSAVRWGGSARTTTYVNSTKLTAVITPDDLATAGTGTVTVYNPTPGGGTSGGVSFTITSVASLSFLTTRLPDAAQGKQYSYNVQASGGISPYTYALTSGGLPSGLSLASDGVISGTPPSVSSDTTYSFTAQVSDFSYNPVNLTKPFSLLVRAGSLGRNETCSTATPISNGVIRASISPYGDVDVYSFQGTAGSLVTIEIYAQRLTLYSGSTTTDDFLDSFLELLNSSCTRLTYSDDISTGTITDSLISSYSLPYTGTYYIRVSDLRGDGRPDFIYEVHLSGAN